MKSRSQKGTGMFAAKIDMAKAYDCVEWHFIEGVMVRMGFDRRWVDLIMNCVSTVSYSVLVNGHQSEAFIPTRGLRQGDPLSPYLFLLCAEGLLAITKAAVRDKRMHGLKPAQGALTVSHLFFADDSVFFGRATEQESGLLKQILQLYEKESGKLVNFQKSAVSFSGNVRMHQKLMVSGTLQMTMVEKHEKYLGLPTVVGRSKKEIFNGLKDRIRKKLKEWKEKTLSVAGRETLIRSVAQDQLTFAMSIFRIPAAIINKVHSLIMNFYWGQKGSEKRIQWLSREEMLLPKEEGGLGLRDLEGFNTAMLAKQVWRLHQRPSSLVAKIMKAKYYKNTSILEGNIGYRPTSSDEASVAPMNSSATASGGE
ncbi:unnamed protein product [Linum trigynum]|uniref:Reverse transcriptase domain-containing protein n=1 Tax=Linum trigynum TaxID=586398 RepID=A0AAV2E656_9ROSI